MGNILYAWDGTWKIFSVGMYHPDFQKKDLRNWFLGLKLGSREQFFAKFVLQELKFSQNWAWKCKIFQKYGNRVSGAKKWPEKGVLRVARPGTTFECECPLGSVSQFCNLFWRLYCNRQFLMCKYIGIWCGLIWRPLTFHKESQILKILNPSSTFWKRNSM